MESEVAVKDEPVWSMEDEAVLANMKVEPQRIMFSNIKEESLERNMLIEGENSHAVTSLFDVGNGEIKTEIDIEDHNVLEYVPCCEGSGDVGGLNLNTQKPECTGHKKEMELSCDTGNKQFGNDSKMYPKSNLRMVSDKTVEKRACVGSNICFERCKEFAEHSRMHSGEKLFTCEVCGKYFTRRGELVEHLRIHSKVCSANFTTSRNLKVHTSMHTGEKPFQCEVCSKRFSTSSNLARHIKLHSGEKRFECEVCSKSFTQSVHLLNHIRIHTGEKPFKCEVCNKRFSTSGNLARHMSLHTGEMPFKCEECGKCFAQFRNLKHHICTLI